MDGIVQLAGRRLLGSRGGLGCGFKIDVNFADSAGLAGLWVPFEAGAVDLAKAALTASVHHDVHVVQLGTPAFLKGDGLARLDGEQGAVALGFGNGEAFRALLDLEAELAGNVAYGLAHAVAPVEIKAGDDDHHEDGGDGEPAAQAGGVHGSSLNGVRGGGLRARRWLESLHSLRSPGLALVGRDDNASLLRGRGGERANEVTESELEAAEVRVVVLVEAEGGVDHIAGGEVEFGGTLGEAPADGIEATLEPVYRGRRELQLEVFLFHDARGEQQLDAAQGEHRLAVAHAEGLEPADLVEKRIVDVG